MPVAQTRSSFTPRDGGLLVLLGVVWGHSFLFVKVAVASISPPWIVAGRIAVGAALLLVVVSFRRPQRVVWRRGLVLTLLVAGVLGSAVPWILQGWAIQYLDSGLVAVLNATTPAATLVVAVVVGQEYLHLSRVAGLAIALTGTVIVIGGEIGGGSPVLPLVVASAATVGFGFSGVLTRGRISNVVPALPAAAAQLALAAPVVVVIATVVAGPPPGPSEVSLPAALALLALGIGGTGLGYLIHQTLIARVGATNASMVTYLVPVVGLTAGAVYRGEEFGWNVILGTAVLVAGVWLAQRRPLEPTPASPELEEAILLG